MSGDILLARHGQTADNADGLILGQHDPPLSELGVTQAHRLARAVRAIDLRSLWTSPLLRARQTAAIVAEATALEPRVLPELIESARGRWEGREVARLAEAERERYEALITGEQTFAFPGGESLGSQTARTRTALQLIACGELPALVVPHVGTIRAVLAISGARLPPEAAVPNGRVAVRVRCGNGAELTAERMW